MANTSTIHIKTDFDCKVYDYDKEIGSTKADTFCNFELRKGEHELTFVYTEDESISKTITYEVKDTDCDYQLILGIAETMCDRAKQLDANSQSTAFTLYSLAAKKGCAKAQNALGVCYDLGNGVEKNLTKAAEWYLKAAEQGYAPAQNNLGFCYDYGEGVKKNITKAVEWYIKSAEQGNKFAQFNLGHCYESGKGVEKNFAKAVELYTKAAEQGYATAQCGLGVCYEYGNGVDKNLAIAMGWFSKAAEQENATAQFNLGICYEYGKGTEIDFVKAIEWYTKAAEQGYATAQCKLGVCYEYGKGVEKDLTKAVEWYTKAAEQGDATAQFNLGVYYEYKDLGKAIEWYTKAAEQGHAEAQFTLGGFYDGTTYYKGSLLLDSNVPDRDLNKAIEWYTKAAKQGHEAALIRLDKNNKDCIYYLFFDTETTGLFVDEKQSFDPHHSFFKHNLQFQLMRQPHMVQLSWITTDKDCNIISKHDYIIQPKGFSIPPEATRIHGITTEIAKEKGAPIKEVIEKFLEDVYAANTLVGHNIAFDRRVINTELIRLRLNNEYDDTNSYDFDSKESICTMKESTLYCEIPSRNYYHPYKQPKLQELHKKLFGYEFEDAHNSMSDVTATLKCFKEMKKLGWI